MDFFQNLWRQTGQDAEKKETIVEILLNACISYSETWIKEKKIYYTPKGLRIL
jgi:S-adenosylmethionine/arginine decarboxylase-like enzyme